MASSARREPEPHPLARGASPATIRQWLLPDDADRFVSEHENALDTARTALDLTDVHQVVERWRAIAILQTPTPTSAPCAAPPSSPRASPRLPMNPLGSPPPEPVCSR